MKRRYKEGDWFRVPLSGTHDAVGVIARACRSRLFAYFFAVPARTALSHDMLRKFHATQAALCALFGGAPLEDLRWPLIATSLHFDRTAWPFPEFGLRGAFARTWRIVAYDASTMQAARSESASEAQAAALPDARFATAGELEAQLRERICGVLPEKPVTIAEVRSPLDPESLRVLVRGGRVQFSESLDQADLDCLARFIAVHPDVELRVHGFERFDLRALQRFEALRSLILDVGHADGVEGLIALSQLSTLRTGARNILPALARLPRLRTLELRRGAAKIEATSLELLTLVDTDPPRLSDLPCAPNLRELTLAHMTPLIEDIGALPMLARLELRDLALRQLPDLSRNMNLRSVALRGVRHLRDLEPLTRAPQLAELRIERMPQLEVSDFARLAAQSRLHAIVDVGSRQKEREINRLLRSATNA
jgi:hypothetical protein